MILIDTRGKTYIVDPTKDFHFQDGFIRAADLQSGKKRLITNKSVEVGVVFDNFSDQFKKIKRGAQIITRKDIGQILSHIFVDKSMTCIDAGTGTGALTCALAKYAKKVHSIDMRDDHIALGKQNAEKLGLTNITFHKADVYEGFPVKKAHVVTLDVPEPQNCVAHVENILVPGGYLVCYVPGANQLQAIVAALQDKKTYIVEKSVEIIEKEWKVTDRILRPQTHYAIHTGFLLFARRL